jgi:hypothetical protein
MESANSQEFGESPFSVWTFEKKDIWKQEQLQSKVDEYNRLLSYCNELENKLDVLGAKSGHQQFSQVNFQGSAKNKIIFLEEYKTLIFLGINILFIIFITIFFYYHPEKEYYPFENSAIIKK